MEGETPRRATERRPIQGSPPPLGTSSLFLGLGALYNAGPDLVEVDRATGKHTFELNFDESYETYRAYKVP